MSEMIDPRDVRITIAGHDLAGFVEGEAGLPLKPWNGKSGPWLGGLSHGAWVTYKREPAKRVKASHGRKAKRYSHDICGCAQPPIRRMTRKQRSALAVLYVEEADGAASGPASDSEVARKAASLGRPRRSRQNRSDRQRGKDRVEKRIAAGGMTKVPRM